MTTNERNVIPVTMALLLHVAVFGSLVFAFEFRDRATPAIPLAISATLVTDNAVVIPPKVEEQPPPPEPEPDTSEQDRRRAEEQKRLDDLPKNPPPFRDEE